MVNDLKNSYSCSFLNIFNINTLIKDWMVTCYLTPEKFINLINWYAFSCWWNNIFQGINIFGRLVLFSCLDVFEVTIHVFNWASLRQVSEVWLHLKYYLEVGWEIILGYFNPLNPIQNSIYRGTRLHYSFRCLSLSRLILLVPLYFSL